MLSHQVMYVYSLSMYTPKTPHIIKLEKKIVTGNIVFSNKVIDEIDSYPQCSKTDIRMGKVLAAIGRFFCFVQVNQSTVGIKERFGKFEEVLNPGCHFMPWIIGNRVSGQLTLRLRQLDVRCETKTKVLISNF